ncbi:hypothetical protein EJ04DRAFT_119278 [Polyplosphaeria fusca]|uniref:Uncharacterized protein n=1 Tax=Polyplosphaeria fusca TaxID=682080 RepID=A0A9P4UXD6_9PLEO|nr:hypothetical protein EJ04DRAFT_119278 [Polyplosphaeria fusca]
MVQVWCRCDEMYVGEMAGEQPYVHDDRSRGNHVTWTYKSKSYKNANKVANCMRPKSESQLDSATDFDKHKRETTKTRNIFLDHINVIEATKHAIINSDTTRSQSTLYKITFTSPTTTITPTSPHHPKAANTLTSTLSPPSPSTRLHPHPTLLLHLQILQPRPTPNPASAQFHSLSDHPTAPLPTSAPPSLPLSLPITPQSPDPAFSENLTGPTSPPYLRTISTHPPYHPEPHRIQSRIHPQHPTPYPNFNETSICSSVHSLPRSPRSAATLHLQRSLARARSRSAAGRTDGLGGVASSHAG